jgi:hypothetical protein
MKAIWNGAVLAESDETIVVEGNHYFPADSINKEYFRPSETHTVCGWKGTDMQSLTTLEYGKLLALVARHAQTPMGRRGWKICSL